MFFLIEYDRTKGKILGFDTFENLDRNKAENARLDLELKIRQRGIEREVVLLEATTKEAMRRTHRRYFESLFQLVSGIETSLMTVNTTAILPAQSPAVESS